MKKFLLLGLIVTSGVQGTSSSTNLNGKHAYCYKKKSNNPNKHPYLLMECSSANSTTAQTKCTDAMTKKNNADSEYKKNCEKHITYACFNRKDGSGIQCEQTDQDCMSKQAQYGDGKEYMHPEGVPYKCMPFTLLTGETPVLPKPEPTETPTAASTAAPKSAPTATPTPATTPGKKK